MRHGEILLGYVLLMRTRDDAIGIGQRFIFALRGELLMQIGSVNKISETSEFNHMPKISSSQPFIKKR